MCSSARALCYRTGVIETALVVAGTIKQNDRAHLVVPRCLKALAEGSQFPRVVTCCLPLGQHLICQSAQLPGHDSHLSGSALHAHAVPQLSLAAAPVLGDT